MATQRKLCVLVFACVLSVNGIVESGRVRRGKCSTISYLGLVGAVSKIGGNTSICKTQAAGDTNGGVTDYVEVANCNGACYNVADTMFDAFANLNCDVQLSDLSAFSKTIDPYLPTGFKVADILAKATTVGMTQVTHTQFQTGADDLHQLCQPVDGGTTTCQQQFMALQNISDPDHVKTCNALADECTDLVASIVAYGQAMPLLNPYLGEFDMADLRKNCNTLLTTTMTPTSTPTHIPTTLPTQVPTKTPTKTPTKLGAPPTTASPTSVSTLPTSRPPSMSPTAATFVSTTTVFISTTATLVSDTTATTSLQTRSPIPAPPPTKDHPECQKLQVTLAVLSLNGSSDGAACMKQIQDGQAGDQEKLMANITVCDSVCEKTMYTLLDTMAGLDCDLQLQTIADLVGGDVKMGNQTVQQLIDAEKKNGVTEIAHGQLEDLRSLLSGLCAPLANSPVANCQAEFAAFDNVEDINHNAVCKSSDVECLELAERFQVFATAMGQNFDDKTLTAKCSNAVVWPTGVVNRVSTTDSTDDNNSKDHKGDKGKSTSTLSIVLPAVVASIFVFLGVGAVVYFLRRRQSRKMHGNTYSQLEAAVDDDVDMNEMDNLGGHDVSIVSGGLVLNHSHEGSDDTYEDAFSPQVFGQR